ncbi:class I SAM-dependent DNA methyltransferase [Gracilibacillus timonensis]|uniref:class I SAM-dependent DNA methyltransferase n=1 Tax=Gracilibacillus timonensis TaxID=1816696 RepID=UPI0008241140|nr:class I SAM-dependent methyltransferase [Gracilibacillus timonensis]
MGNNAFNKQHAKRYDTEDRRKLANIIADKVKTVLPDKKQHSLLDYGGGTGLVTLPLAGHFDNVLLLDASQEMIHVAQDKLAQIPYHHIEARKLDLMEDDQLDVNADVILVSLVLIHVPDVKALLQKLKNRLNEGGLFLIVDFDKNERVDHPKVHNGFTREEINELLTNMGLHDIEINTFYHGKNLFVNQDASLFIATSRG